MECQLLLLLTAGSGGEQQPNSSGERQKSARRARSDDAKTSLNDSLQLEGVAGGRRVVARGARRRRRRFGHRHMRAGGCGPVKISARGRQIRANPHVRAQTTRCRMPPRGGLAQEPICAKQQLPIWGGKLGGELRPKRDWAVFCWIVAGSWPCWPGLAGGVWALGHVEPKVRRQGEHKNPARQRPGGPLTMNNMLT